MELEEQSGVDTCKGDSEKICWPLVQAEKRGCFLAASCMVVWRGTFLLRGSRPAAGEVVWATVIDFLRGYGAF